MCHDFPRVKTICRPLCCEHSSAAAHGPHREGHSRGTGQPTISDTSSASIKSRVVVNVVKFSFRFFFLCSASVDKPMRLTDSLVLLLIARCAWCCPRPALAPPDQAQLDSAHHICRIHFRQLVLEVSTPIQK